MYTVSNILKSTQLCIISPFAIDILYQTMYLDQWNNNYIKNVGILYAIPDGVIPTFNELVTLICSIDIVRTLFLNQSVT